MATQSLRHSSHSAKRLRFRCPGHVTQDDIRRVVTGWDAVGHLRITSNPHGRAEMSRDTPRPRQKRKDGASGSGENGPQQKKIQETNRLAGALANALTGVVEHAVSQALYRLDQSHAAPPRGVESAPEGTTRHGDWISNADAMERYTISRSTLQRWRKAQKIAYSKVDGLIFYRLRDLEALFEDHVVRGGLPAKRGAQRKDSGEGRTDKQRGR